jgi:hypothetical protein
MLGPVYINVLGVDDEIDTTSTGMALNPGIVLGTPTASLTIDPSQEFQGVALGGDFGVFAFDLGVSSLFDWNEDDNGTDGNVTWRVEASDYTADDNEYVTTLSDGRKLVATGKNLDLTSDDADVNRNSIYNIFFSGTITPADIISVVLAANYAGQTNTIGLGASVNFSMPLGDMSLDVQAGTDMSLKGSTADIQIGAGAGLGFAGDVIESTEYFDLDADDEID